MLKKKDTVNFFILRLLNWNCLQIYVRIIMVQILFSCLFMFFVHYVVWMKASSSFCQSWAILCQVVPSVFTKSSLNLILCLLTFFHLLDFLERRTLSSPNRWKEIVLIWCVGKWRVLLETIITKIWRLTLWLKFKIRTLFKKNHSLGIIF